MMLTVHEWFYLKAQTVDLSRGYIRPTPGHWQTRDIIGVSLQEFLLAIFDCPQNDRWSQRVDQVLSVRVEPQARTHTAWNLKKTPQHLVESTAKTKTWPFSLLFGWLRLCGSMLLSWWPQLRNCFHEKTSPLNPKTERSSTGGTPCVSASMVTPPCASVDRG